MNDEEREAAYTANGYRWPPAHATEGWPPRPVPESEAYAKSRDRIEAKIRSIPDYKLHWDEFFALTQSRLMPSFTPRGFDKIKAPEHLWLKLRAAYEEGLMSSVKKDAAVKLRPESFTHKPGSDTPAELLPNFIYPPRGLNDAIMEELRPLHEEWAGVKLQNGQSYGIRVYKNGSTLVNHVDRSETHVVSCIFHIGNDLDEPWPLEIEDHDGKVHAVVMEPGEMVLYESSKQYHARVTPMRGRHYGSLFIHYFPAENNWNWTMWDVHTAVPPDFLNPKVDAARSADFDDGEWNLGAYYREYWEARGEGAPPMAMGIDEPVQSFSHLEGRVEYEAPAHVEDMEGLKELLDKINREMNGNAAAAGSAKEEADGESPDEL